jgi:hypothetical protein
MLRGLILVVALAGAACATSRWERAGATEADRQRDETECTARANRDYSVPGRRVISSSRRDVNESVELVTRREFDVAAYEACMEGRGYRRVPVGAAQ